MPSVMIYTSNFQIQMVDSITIYNSFPHVHTYQAYTYKVGIGTSIRWFNYITMTAATVFMINYLYPYSLSFSKSKNDTYS